MPVLPKKIQSKNNATFLLREIRETDAADLNALILSVLKTSPHALNTPTEVDLSTASQVKRIRRFIEETGYIIFVIEKDGQLIGTLDFKNNSKIQTRHWGEFGMGIRPEYRGIGLGKHLLIAFLDWAKENPVIEKIALEVYVENVHAHQLYLDMGFIEEGRNVKAIKKGPGQYFDTIRMYLLV